MLLLITAIPLLLLGAFLLPLPALMLPALVLAFLVLLATLLLIPFHLSGQISRREGRSRVRFAVRGIVGFSRTTEDGETTSVFQLFRRTRRIGGVEQEGIDGAEVKTKKRTGIPTAVLLGVLPALPDLIGAVLRVLNAFRMSVTMEQMKGEVRVGLGDASQTGMLVGLTHAIGGMVSPWADVSELTLLPVFDEAVLEGDLEMNLRLRLLGLVFPATRLFFKEPIRRLMVASARGG